jgi:hypothetical protein
MTKRTVLFVHETSSEFTTCSLELVRYTQNGIDSYWFNITETFEKDSHGLTESFSSVCISHEDVMRLSALLAQSVYSYPHRINQSD